MKSTPKCRCSFANVIGSTAAKDSNNYAWQITAMFDKNNAEHMAWIKNELRPAYDACIKAKFPDAASRPKIPLTGHAKSPLKDADSDTDGQGRTHADKYPEMAGHYLLRMAAQDKVKTEAAKRGENVGEMVTRYRHRVVDASMRDITDADDLYSGCWVRVNGEPYWRTVPTNPGVSFGLKGVQKIEDDEPFGNSVPKAEAMFDAENPVNYDDDPFGGSSEAEVNDYIPF